MCSTFCPLAFGRQRRVGTPASSQPWSLRPGNNCHIKSICDTSAKPFVQYHDPTDGEGEGEVDERMNERERANRSTEVPERSTPPIPLRHRHSRFIMDHHAHSLDTSMTPIRFLELKSYALLVFLVGTVIVMPSFFRDEQIGGNISSVSFELKV